MSAAPDLLSFSPTLYLVVGASASAGGLLNYFWRYQDGSVPASVMVAIGYVFTGALFGLAAFWGAIVWQYQAMHGMIAAALVGYAAPTIATKTEPIIHALLRRGGIEVERRHETPGIEYGGPERRSGHRVILTPEQRARLLDLRARELELREARADDDHEGRLFDAKPLP